eukprot:365129-Chlamydomonas_euryale.AAC.2
MGSRMGSVRTVGRSCQDNGSGLDGVLEDEERPHKSSAQTSCYPASLPYMLGSQAQPNPLLSGSTLSQLLHRGGVTNHHML